MIDPLPMVELEHKVSYLPINTLASHFLSIDVSDGLLYPSCITIIVDISNPSFVPPNNTLANYSDSLSIMVELEDCLNKSPTINNMDNLGDYMDTFSILIFGIFPRIYYPPIDITDELGPSIMPHIEGLNDPSKLFIKDV